MRRGSYVIRRISKRVPLADRSADVAGQQVRPCHVAAVVDNTDTSMPRIEHMTSRMETSNRLLTSPFKIIRTNSKGEEGTDGLVTSCPFQ
ncbi:hypothetical protein Tco_0374783 [Tanacetum coccineum]